MFEKLFEHIRVSLDDSFKSGEEFTPVFLLVKYDEAGELRTVLVARETVVTRSHGNLEAAFEAIMRLPKMGACHVAAYVARCQFISPLHGTGSGCVVFIGNGESAVYGFIENANGAPVAREFELLTREDIEEEDIEEEDIGIFENATIH